MEIFLLIVHVIVCAVLILVILMQPGRSGGLSGGAFGGMGGGGTSMFGGGGAVPMLAKVTTYVGIIFALTCIGLWYAGRSTDSVPSTVAERLMEEGQMPMAANSSTFDLSGNHSHRRNNPDSTGRYRQYHAVDFVPKWWNW